jgi:hypothetical protein
LRATKGKTKAAIRRVYLSEKAKKILSAGMERFDGENLFPQNDIDDEQTIKTLNKAHTKKRNL